ncbi:hypothetical protein FIBSPDRAFT_520 [Athelia psychrophila]|uniref:Uncharacterized protein n=1 Tax=Athelia psychrophila TaxID=1759441 RepID=A0A166WVN7_9AGAM|nr:hypothetical protein FIBSPDRAFT_520 [Fibularhizoctonia sp. CBS 109695]
MVDRVKSILKSAGARHPNFPELAISSKAPAVITYGKVRMRLTGLTDYLLWKFPEKQYQALEGTRCLYWCNL